MSCCAPIALLSKASGEEAGLRLPSYKPFKKRRGSATYSSGNSMTRPKCHTNSLRVCVTVPSAQSIKVNSRQHQCPDRTLQRVRPWDWVAFGTRLKVDGPLGIVEAAAARWAGNTTSSGGVWRAPRVQPATVGARDGTPCPGADLGQMRLSWKCRS